MKVMIVGPDRQDPGGVANYYNAVFPRLGDNEVTPYYLAIGSTYAGSGVKHIITDQIRYWKALSEYKPDLVHLNPSLDLKSYLRDGLFIWQAKLRNRLVLVFFRGWNESLERTVSGSLRWFFQCTYARADAFIVLASKFSDRLRGWGVQTPIILGTTTVADELLEGFSMDLKAEDLRQSQPVQLLFLGRLEKEKGVMDVLEAVTQLLEEGAEIALTIAGDGPMMNEVQQVVARLDRYRDKIRVIGYVRGSAKQDVLRSHHIYCFPTQYMEGMPNSVLEAMAFGMPIVTCPAGGIADFFEDKKMGVLLPDRESGGIKTAIISLISERNRLAEIGRYNHEYAKTRFLASCTAQSLRTYYKSVVSSGR
jgi:glycosyltransferase involved in cell wall biosynthesis